MVKLCEKWRRVALVVWSIVINKTKLYAWEEYSNLKVDEINVNDDVVLCDAFKR